MASKEVSGKTADEIEQLREEYNERHSDNPQKWFEKAYCLAKIPHQPEDYDGPPRYCLNPRTSQIGDSWRCKHHGANGHGNPENLEKLAPMTHGLRALRKHIRQDFDEKDLALYNWVVEDYPSAYDINIEESPADAYDVHRLAVEIVRAERGRGHLLNEGEVHEEEVRDDEGRVVVDDTGEIVTSKSQHYLARMMKDQDNKITKLQKELGISRKERQRADNAEDAVEAVKQFSELGAAFLNRDEKEYSADEEPWDDSE